MRVLTALLLLFTLVLTLGLGVHPCGAMEMEKEHHPAEAQAAPAMPSCHSQAAPAPAQAAEGSRGGSEKSSDHPCPHVCHATALPAVTPPPFLTTQAATELIAGPVKSASAAPARSIDHVPLA